MTHSPFLIVTSKIHSLDITYRQFVTFYYVYPHTRTHTPVVPQHQKSSTEFSFFVHNYVREIFRNNNFLLTFLTPTARFSSYSCTTLSIDPHGSLRSDENPPMRPREVVSSPREKLVGRRAFRDFGDSARLFSVTSICRSYLRRMRTECVCARGCPSMCACVREYARVAKASRRRQPRVCASERERSSCSRRK